MSSLIPPPAYPTTPPWGTPEQPATPAAPAPPAAPPRLFVQFPEEMARAARPAAPSWLPVVFWTLLLGVPGAVSAVRRSSEARRGGNERYPYWLAFGTVIAAAAVTLTFLGYA
ncbi:hypothetical protein [Paractinoplanes brasiliensis]|uniref:Uncharacterized protein n=1 Tax=Paractinoplanes brasiliensis TaxID=52695 RepID=A0A4R6JNF0_9ACTN|nr:hypothetical protein [Actinoplanes brasiliensis]TDO37944.1 hypothetical protein C8E87_1582 [Actinoplanes brasiliensis]GID31034.1 hypothetical protein Abr02nite_60170 [Actinoplanes brasiliensis]